MKEPLKIIIIVKVFFVIVINGIAQSEITLDDLRSSSAPAFNILDIEPKAISRPTTPKPVATNLVSAFD